MLTERSLKSILAALKEFGYESITLDEVKAQVEKLARGEKPDIGSGMMIQSMIEEAGIKL